MSRKLLDTLGHLQRAAMEIVWELGEASVHEVRNRMKREKKLAYTTVLTAMQKLEKAGWLQHKNKGKVYIYFPTRSREEAGARSVRKFIERMFEGDAVLMFQHLMEEDKLKEEELVELRRMIDRKRKERKNDK
jgi:predicted transcriptional regulator